MATLLEVLQMLKRIRSNRNSLSLLLGVHNATATLEASLAVSYKTNILLSDDPTIKLLGVYPRAENLCPHKNLIYSSFIHNCQTGKQPRCPSGGEWIN